MNVPERIVSGFKWWVFGDRRRTQQANEREAAVAVEPPDPPGHDELVTLVKSFPYWYQRIYLGRGVYTLDQPTHHERVWRRFKPVFPPDLLGASVLDVGSNAGYFSIEMKKRGAGRVVGIESVDDYLRQARLCAQIWKMDIEYLPMDAHDLPKVPDVFDIVLFTGILYHLKNPLQVLEEASRVCRDAIVVETEVIVDDPRNVVYVRQGQPGKVRVTACHTGIMKFIETYELSGDGSNWWVPDTECVLGMLRTVGFKYFSAPCYADSARLLVVASKKQDSILNLQALK